MRWMHFLIVLALGCGQGADRPPAGKAADFDPDAAAAQVLKIGDRNGNGAIEFDESSYSLPLQSAFADIDTDNSKSLSRDELVKRFTLYKSAASTMVNFYVTYNDGPLEGALLTITPEEYIPGLKVATGTTDATGRCAEFMVDGQRAVGLSPGLYKIKIEKTAETKPESFQSIFQGREIFADPRKGQADLYLKLGGR